MIKSGNYAEQFAALQSSLAGVDIASVLQQVESISLDFCGINLSWVPSEVGGIDIIVPIAGEYPHGCYVWRRMRPMSFRQNSPN